MAFDTTESKDPPRSRRDAAQSAFRPERQESNSGTEIDIEAGWPPQIKGATSGGSSSPSVSSDWYIGDHDLQRSLEVALDDAEVAPYKEGRWEVLGCHLFAKRRAYRSTPLTVKVAVFNYTTNQLIDITVEDEQVVQIEEKESHENPEAAIEIAQAIAVAKADPNIRGKVDELAAHGILQVPPDGPSRGHRCILVMFTEQDDPDRELPVLYSAIVDLTLQSVILSGAAPPCQCRPKSTGSIDGAVIGAHSGRAQ